MGGQAARRAGDAARWGGRLLGGQGAPLGGGQAAGYWLVGGFWSFRV